MGALLLADFEPGTGHLRACEEGGRWKSSRTVVACNCALILFEMLQRAQRDAASVGEMVVDDCPCEPDDVQCVCGTLLAVIRRTTAPRAATQRRDLH